MYAKEKFIFIFSMDFFYAGTRLYAEEQYEELRRRRRNCREDGGENKTGLYAVFL